MRKQSANNKKNKSTFKAPYFNNPDLAIHSVKKSMRPQLEGPTVDNFSTIDSTNSTKQSNSWDVPIESSRVKRPTNENNRKLSISNEWIFSIIFSVVSFFVGTVIYNHSNRIVSVEKDIDYIKDNTKDTKSDIEKLKDQSTHIDRKIDLLKQKSEIEKNTNKNR